MTEANSAPANQNQVGSLHLASRQGLVGENPASLEQDDVELRALELRAPDVARQETAARRRRRQRGFTLIEILVVVTILGIIAAIAGVAVMNQLDQAKIDTTKIQLSEIAKALDIYKVKYNRYPTTQEGLQALKNPPKDGKPVMEIIKKDEWENDFIYVSPGQHNPSKFDLQSKGPDGTADSEDDITNW
ncbi:MAG: type II secretion system major pseudopilin GspG [Deltaproteobacteria bacterium]|nr:type II secretion system major pseudopilin GspG [Deltaproteobacteria bacterium]